MAVNRETTVRKIVSMPRELVREIEDFRRMEHPIPSEAEAIRRAIRLGVRTAAAARNNDGASE